MIIFYKNLEINMRVPLEIFISHADEDKKIAREIADEMEKHEGINVFVAHEDLEPGTNWKDDLTKKIFDCDVFLILLTEKFHPAEWTEQEVGIAHAFDRRIIPVRFDYTPTKGFMNDYQATKLIYPIDTNEIKNLVDVIFAYSEEGQRHINQMIDQLQSATRFVDANAYARMLFKTTSKFTDEQINRIATVFLDNYEIRTAWTSGPKCLELFQRNWKRITSDLRELLKPHIQHSS